MAEIITLNDGELATVAPVNANFAALNTDIGNLRQTVDGVSSEIQTTVNTAISNNNIQIFEDISTAADGKIEFPNNGICTREGGNYSFIVFDLVGATASGYYTALNVLPDDDETYLVSVNIRLLSETTNYMTFDVLNSFGDLSGGFSNINARVGDDGNNFFNVQLESGLQSFTTNPGSNTNRMHTEKELILPIKKSYLRLDNVYHPTKYIAIGVRNYATAPSQHDTSPFYYSSSSKSKILAISLGVNWFRKLGINE